MGTSWTQRHRHETDEFKSSEKKRYNAWKTQFTTTWAGKVTNRWDERKVQEWVQEYRAKKFPHWPTSKEYLSEKETE